MAIECVSSGKDSAPPLIAPGDLEYAATLTVAAGLSALPPAMRTRVIHQASQFLGTILYKTNRDTVRRVRYHLRCFFDYEGADPTLESQVRSQLILTTWNAIIINLLPSLRQDQCTHLLRIEGLHHLAESRRRNEAVLLMGYHYGAYGFAVAATLSAQGHPACLAGYGDSHTPRPGTSHLYHKLYWPRVQNLQRRVRVITVDPNRRSQRELSEILEQKEDVILLLADQYFIVPPGQEHPGHLVPLRLLNHTVYLDVTGVQLAKQAGARPLTAIPRRAGARQRVVVEPMDWASDGTAAADIAEDLQAYISRLEQHLLECPALWRDLRRTDLLSRMGMVECEQPA